MRLGNNSEGYGVIAILFHWISAVLIITLYWLGDYIVDLTYYDDWYNTAPRWHEALGLAALTIFLLRLTWKLTQPRVAHLSHYRPWELKLAIASHYSLYLLVFVACVSGYFIPTAKGVGIDVFGLFELPAITKLSESTAEIVAEVHEISTLALILIVVVHALGALKHHFIDKDITLIRMIKPFK